jgi:hypothetical protein
LLIGFLEVIRLVEVEVRKSEPGIEKTTATTLDVNEIISKVREFIDNIKEMSAGGQPMAVNVDAFNFSVGKEKGEYDLALRINLTLTPKEA